MIYDKEFYSRKLKNLKICFLLNKQKNIERKI